MRIDRKGAGVKSAIGRAVVALLLLGSVTAVAPASAQEKTGIKPGFTLAPGSAKILLLRPKIRVGSQSTGGMMEPNAEWTDQAKANIGAALAAVQSQLGNQIVTAEEPVGDDAQKLADYNALFSAVADAVITYQFFPGNRLPTKKRDGVFEWSLGPEVKSLPGAADADYALFIFTEDQFGSTGRKVAQVFAAALIGVSISSGVHKGYAGLIDLKTGNLVWLNADQEMGGDVRRSDGAQRRVAQLLEGFPGRPAVAATTPATATPATAAPAIAAPATVAPADVAPAAAAPTVDAPAETPAPVAAMQ
jgi:hypothetical protein